MSEQQKLRAALVSAQRVVDVASKDATNLHHKYDYASAEEIVSVAAVALSGAGLAFAEERSSFEPFAAELLRDRTAAKGHAQDDGVGGALGLLTVTYALVHESGERIEIAHVFPVVPERGRPLDKALAASRTECLAYALRGLLLIERRPKDQAGRAKGKRKAPPLDVSGRSDAPSQAAPPPLPVAAPQVVTAAPPPQPVAAPQVATAAPDPPAAAPQSRSPRPADAPPPTEQQLDAAGALAAIAGAGTLAEGQNALEKARRNKAVDGLKAEAVYSAFILRKVEAARAAKRPDWIEDIHSHLTRAGLGADAARAPRAAIAAARAELRGG